MTDLIENTQWKTTKNVVFWQCMIRSCGERLKAKMPPLKRAIFPCQIYIQKNGAKIDDFPL